MPQGISFFSVDSVLKRAFFELNTLYMLNTLYVCMKNLYLVLKNPWFDMIKSGEKKEEYRELSEFYKRRFYDKSGNLKKFDTLEFVLGYPRKDDMSKRLFSQNQLLL